MFNLVYTSMAQLLFTPEQLAAVLKQSRVNNKKWGITGVLLVRNGQFIQALEGEEAAVRKLAATIQQDPRHDTFKVLYEGPIEQRHFPDWAMGFCELPQTDETQGESLINRMLAGTVTASSPADGARLLRAIFRAFAVDGRSNAA
ncbi:MAG: BLUF domain-containing protein [Archangium sp.]|nr:BLUF domain-containing protein [Archangium sp.]MDP3153136.1 BLUF domain-containing protein [Archangium sp.]MDP3572269.1 BLUF domain-containing protein [Archangium sp.]